MRNLRAQGFDDRVAAGDHLGVTSFFAGAPRRRLTRAGIRPALVVLRPSRLEAFLGCLALAGDVPAAVGGLRGRTLAFELLAAVTAGADGGAFLFPRAPGRPGLTITNSI